MCGIVGYIGKKQALPFLIEGLKRLEYRGYDSAGVCISNGAGFFVVKRKGKVRELETAIKNSEIIGSVGISHTRWATHGQPNEINAHPHLDCKKQIAIVHNGIVENFVALKKMLEKEGHKIISETDSEIIAHLVEKFYLSPHRSAKSRIGSGDSGDFEKAVAKALKLIEGAYAVLIIDKKGGKIIAAKKSSPLVIGFGKSEMFAASDISALLGRAEKVIYLKDEEIAEIAESGCFVKNFKGKLLDKKTEKIKMTLEQIGKGKFKHFMLKEVFEQPLAIENALRGRIKDGKVKLGAGLNPKTIKRIIIVACGTSYYAALVGKHLIEEIAGIPVEVDYASEFRYRNPIIKEGDLVVATSQSGETADTLAAIKEAKAHPVKSAKGGAKQFNGAGKARTLGIVNVVGSTIAREVDSGIYLHAGPEIGVASTKAFVCQVAVLVLLAFSLKEKMGKSDKIILNELQKIPEKIKQVLKKSDEIRKFAAKLKNCRNFIYLGRGVNFPVALEGALKLKELSYIHAEGLPAAEMKHGPIALVDENMPVVFLATKNGAYDKILSNMEEVKARGGKIIAITDSADEKIKRLAEYVISVPKTIDIFSPLVNVIPLQLLAYHAADLKGLNVDKPRNLAKSVTVE